MRRRIQSGDERHGEDSPADTYTLLATLIEGDEVSDLVETTTPCSTQNISDKAANRVHAASQNMAELGDAGGNAHRTSEVTPNGKNHDIVEQVISLSPANQSSRIEDSVEALDELEEQLEAINAVAHLERILSPDAGRPKVQKSRPSPSPHRTPQRAGPPSNKTTPKTGASNATRANGLGRTGSVRKSTAAPPTKDVGKEPAHDPLKRLLVARPASLLPPKPPAKSTKRPTMPTFELPGEAVARRLKEQKEARLSMQASPDRAPAKVSPARPKSSKPPTRPTFELPGEAISRRKREAHEAKLRQQEEEERMRREFKAKPNRSSIVPTTLPRETISSRARQNKVAGAEDGPSPNKRHSVAMTQSRLSSALAPGGSSQSASLSPSRGRNSVMSSTRADRETSTSTGSVGKRSTMSAEELKRQGVRGRDIYTRDNSYAADRERERREREALAKQAREEAAERSRQLSREWAEKQRLKKLSG